MHTPVGFDMVEYHMWYRHGSIKTSLAVGSATPPFAQYFMFRRNVRLFLEDSSPRQKIKVQNRLSKQETLRSLFCGFLCSSNVPVSLITCGHIFACKRFDAAEFEGILSDTLTA